MWNKIVGDPMMMMMMMMMMTWDWISSNENHA
jgi:hypothetical protein